MDLKPGEGRGEPVPAGRRDNDSEAAAPPSLDDLVPGGPSMVSRLGPIVGLAAAVWWLMRRRRG